MFYNSSHGLIVIDLSHSAVKTASLMLSFFLEGNQYTGKRQQTFPGMLSKGQLHENVYLVGSCKHDARSGCAIRLNFPNNRTCNELPENKIGINKNRNWCGKGDEKDVVFLFLT